MWAAFLVDPCNERVPKQRIPQVFYKQSQAHASLSVAPCSYIVPKCCVFLSCTHHDQGVTFLQTVRSWRYYAVSASATCCLALGISIRVGCFILANDLICSMANHCPPPSNVQPVTPPCLYRLCRHSSICVTQNLILPRLIVASASELRALSL